MNNIVNVNVLGKQKAFRTTQDAAKVQAVVDIVNDKIYALAKKHNAEPSEAFGMMAALEIAAELYQLRIDYQHLMSLAQENNE
ncbi:MAG: cell division protein ZapA [Phascolarctobacterium sp.]|nr:cell division protein ZapA [Candidatus Phascolarctobacterium caballi]MCQ2381414.1 cell division protein ZapA [Acidaminococcaceae bacterium]